MPSIPTIGPGDDAAPHVFVLGSGASCAACPEGDRNGRPLPLMKAMADALGLRGLLEHAGVGVDPRDFEGAYDTLESSGEHAALVEEIERRTREYFHGIEIPDGPTVYDYLLLSLRPNDLVATFNWDPLLAQAYRRNRSAAPLPRIAFLHGNVAVGYCGAHRGKGWIEDPCRECGKPFEQAPLLYPVRSKDYEKNPFIKNEWEELRRALRRAYIVTIFGYSAPRTDVAARGLMREAWQLNSARELADIGIINLKGREELRDTWAEFITREHYWTEDSLLRSYVCRHPRRSCEALFARSLENAPASDDFFPEFPELVGLHDWVRPLVEEERRLRESRRPFSLVPCCERQAR